MLLNLIESSAYSAKSKFCFQFNSYIIQDRVVLNDGFCDSNSA